MSKIILPVLALLALIAGGWYLTQSKSSANSGLTSQDSAAEAATADQPDSDLVGDVVIQEKVRTGGPVEETSMPKDAAAVAQATTKSDPNVEGTVVDEQGVPVEGVFVGYTLENTGEFAIYSGDHASKPEAVTDADGHFSFHSDKKGEMHLTFSRSGFIEHRERFELSDTAVNGIGTVVIKQAMVLAGRVIDERGAGIEGVHLSVPSDLENMVFVTDQTRKGDATTGPDGSFVLDTLHPGPYRILLNSGKYRDRVVVGEMPLNLEDRGILWTMQDGLTLRGRVTGIPADESRELAMRLQFQGDTDAEKFMGGSVSGFMIMAEQAALSDTSTFELHGLHPGAVYSLGVLPKDSAGDLWLDDTMYLSELVLVPSDAGSVDVPWSSKGSLRLRLVSAQTGEPITKFVLSTPRWEIMQVLEAAKQEEYGDGVATVDGLSAQHSGFGLILKADGYKTERVENVTITKGSQTDLGTIQLAAAKKAKVLVLSESDGKPIKNARVTINPGEPLPVGEFVTVGEPLDMADQVSEKTDADGVANLQLAGDEEYHISVEHRKFVKAEGKAARLMRHQTDPFVIKMSAGGSVLAKVVDADGKPARGIVVKCEPIREVEPADQRRVSMTFGGPSSGGGSKTNRKGERKFEHLAPGDYLCTVELPNQDPLASLVLVEDSGASEVEGTRVTVLEGEVTEVQLLAPTAGTLEGFIREDGAPLVGAQVSVFESDEDSQLSHLVPGMGGNRARTDADGFYRIENLKPGEKTISIEHGMRAMPTEFSHEVLEGENKFSTELVVTVVAGRVTGPGGEGISGLLIEGQKAEGTESRARVGFAVMTTGGGAMFSASMGDKNRDSVVTDETGHFRLRGVAAGVPIQIVATGEGWTETRSEKMTLPEGAVRTGIEMKATPAGSLSVMVLNRSGEPQGYAAVRLDLIPEEGEASPEPEGTEISNVDGIAKFTSLSPGNYTVVVDQVLRVGGEQNDTKYSPQEVTIKEGEEATVTLKP